MRNLQERKPLSTKDEEYFYQFYEAHKNFMYYIARKYVPSQVDCDDIVQETTLRLLNNISTLSALSHNKAAKYIALTVKSVFLDMEKQKHGNKTYFLSDEILEILLEAELLPEDDISNLSSRMAVESLKRSLPPRDWIALEAKYLMGYTQDELAPLLGVTPDSVRMILCRAREKARIILQNEMEYGGGTNGQ